jgi:hypothetical protein
LFLLLVICSALLLHRVFVLVTLVIALRSGSRCTTRVVIVVQHPATRCDVDVMYPCGLLAVFHLVWLLALLALVAFSSCACLACVLEQALLAVHKWHKWRISAGGHSACCPDDDMSNGGGPSKICQKICSFWGSPMFTPKPRALATVMQRPRFEAYAMLSTHQPATLAAACFTTRCWSTWLRTPRLQLTSTSGYSRHTIRQRKLRHTQAILC